MARIAWANNKRYFFYNNALHQYSSFPRGLLMIDSGFGRSSDSFHTCFATFPRWLTHRSGIVARLAYVVGTHSSGTVRESHPVPSWRHHDGDQNRCKSTTFFRGGKKMLLSLGLGAIIDVARRYFKLLVNHSKESISVT